MRLLFLLLLPFFLFGSKILSYNVYERTQHVDIMLTFDTTYEGKLSQIKKSGNIILKLQGASIESPKIKTLRTSYLRKMTITPINSHTEIILQTAPGVEMSASKTSDAYGLRLRFSKAESVQSTATQQTNSSTASSLPTRGDNKFNNAYFIVIAILIFGIILMLWLKKKMGSSSQSKSKWLFKNTPKKEGISVRFQKPLDPKNRVAMLDFEGQSYLVLLGTSNVLLDKFIDGKPVSTQSEFDKILDDNRTELDSYLQLDPAEVEPLQSYKQKASNSIRELI